MQAIISSSQMREADAYTIAHLPIPSLDLMEKAAAAFVKVFTAEVPAHSRVAVFCGMGNNGGDGYAIARLLEQHFEYHITVYKVIFSKNQSEDNKKNEEALDKLQLNTVVLHSASDFSGCRDDIIVDAILGSGLNGPLSGEYKTLCAKINSLGKKTYSVDAPTGFPAEGLLVLPYNGVKADKTICFQRPKLNFFFPESEAATAQFEVVDIGLIDSFIQSQNSDYFLVEKEDIINMLLPRKAFSHKGNYGHALIVAGQENTMGAAILATTSCLKSGAGLVSACIPDIGLTALNSTVPEAMFLSSTFFLKDNLEKYNAIAIGCGLGTDAAAKQLLVKAINSKKALVLDADALNMMSAASEILNTLPENTILTPHCKEFDRLFGAHDSWWERLQTARKEAVNRKIIIVLKNRYTFICNSDGKVYINPTGNPAMAQGGMGDVLTGVLTGFLAQGYTPLWACIIACYLHGKSGDDLAQREAVVCASQVAKQISFTQKSVTENFDNA